MASITISAKVMPTAIPTVSPLVRPDDSDPPVSAGGTGNRPVWVDMGLEDRLLGEDDDGFEEEEEEEMVGSARIGKSDAPIESEMPAPLKCQTRDGLP